MSGQTPTATVGESKTLIAALTGLAFEHVHHYALAVDSPDGTIVKFCCDDRRTAAGLLRLGANLILSQPGESMQPGQDGPPMPPGSQP